MPYTFKAHTADVRMQVSGRTLRTAFKDALAGMTKLAEPRAPGARVARDLSLSAPDATALLIDFLNEVLILMLTRREAYTRVLFERLGEREAVARLEGKSVAGFGTEIKAVTYHEAELVHGPAGWRTTIIFDV